MSRLVIMGVSEELAQHIKDNGGATKQGNKYLQAAHLIDKAGLLDHLLAMKDHSNDSLNIIKKAVDIGYMLQGETPAPTNEPVVKKEYVSRMITKDENDDFTLTNPKPEFLKEIEGFKYVVVNKKGLFAFYETTAAVDVDEILHLNKEFGTFTICLDNGEKIESVFIDNDLDIDEFVKSNLTDQTELGMLKRMFMLAEKFDICKETPAGEDFIKLALKFYQGMKERIGNEIYVIDHIIDDFPSKSAASVERELDKKFILPVVNPASPPIAKTICKNFNCAVSRGVPA